MGFSPGRAAVSRWAIVEHWGAKWHGNTSHNASLDREEGQRGAQAVDAIDNTGWGADPGEPGQRVQAENSRTPAAATSTTITNTKNNLSSLPKQFKAHCTGAEVNSDCFESGLVCYNDNDDDDNNNIEQELLKALSSFLSIDTSESFNHNGLPQTHSRNKKSAAAKQEAESRRSLDAASARDSVKVNSRPVTLILQLG